MDRPGFEDGRVRLGRSTGHCSTRPGIVRHVHLPRNIRPPADKGCWHPRCNNLCLNRQSFYGAGSGFEELTTHHNSHLRLGGRGLALGNHHCGRSRAGPLGHPDSTNPYFLADDGHSHHRNDPAEGVPT